MFCLQVSPLDTVFLGHQKGMATSTHLPRENAEDVSDSYRQNFPRSNKPDLTKAVRTESAVKRQAKGRWGGFLQPGPEALLPSEAGRLLNLIV